MSNIETFTFDKDGLERVGKFALGRDWPVVYVLENGKEVYIGETTSALSRSKQHHENENRKRLNKCILLQTRNTTNL